MNYLSAITGLVNMVAGGVEGGILGSGNLPKQQVIVQPATDYTPFIALGFAGLVGLIIWKKK